MPKQKETAPKERKSDLLEDDDILDFAREMAGSVDEEILELEDAEEATEEEEDILDLTEVAGHESGDEDEEEILDLTDELEEVPDDEVLELGEIAETPDENEEILVAPEEAVVDDATEDEDILELDDVVAAEAQNAFEIEEDMFDLDDVDEDAEAGVAGAPASNFSIEADTIELSEADRLALEEEFSFEPNGPNSPGDEEEAPSESADRPAEPAGEEPEPEIEMISVLPADERDPWKDTGTESVETGAVRSTDEGDEDTEEIVLDFGDSPGGESAPGEAFFGAFEDRDAAATGEAEPSFSTSSERGDDGGGSDITSETEIETVDPAEDVFQKFDDSVNDPFNEPAEPSPAEIYVDSDAVVDPADEEPREITIETDESDDEEIYAWTDEETDTEATPEPLSERQDDIDRFEEQTFEPEATDAYGMNTAWDQMASPTDSEVAPTSEPETEETDAPLSTEAIFGSDEPTDEAGSDYAVAPTEGTEEMPEEDGMSVHFANSDAFDPQDMHRVADPISIRVKEPAASNEDHADEDDLLNRVFDSESETISTDRLEAIVEAAVNRILGEKIEAILVDAIDRAVTREIDRLKQLVLGRGEAE